MVSLACAGKSPTPKNPAKKRMAAVHAVACMNMLLRDSPDGALSLKTVTRTGLI